MERSDAFRFETMAPSAEAQPRQEWHHFIVHGDGSRIILNLSIADTEGLADPRPAVRFVLLVHRPGSWSGWVENVDYEAVELSGKGPEARFDSSHLRFEESGYDLDLRLPESQVHGRLHFRPRSESMIKANQPLGSGRFTWLLVPRLDVDGHLWAGGIRYSMRSAPAYHDHNWGRFRWGDDFGWHWGAFLGSDRSNPWSLVYWRMMDRGHLTTHGQGVALWRHDEPIAVFRDGAVQVESEGLVRKPPGTTVPSVMSIVAPGTASDIPRSLRVRARRGGDRIDALVTVEEYGRIVVPVNGPGPNVVLHEVSARVETSGRVEGHEVEMEGTGVFEFLH